MNEPNKTPKKPMKPGKPNWQKPNVMVIAMFLILSLIMFSAISDRYGQKEVTKTYTQMLSSLYQGEIVEASFSEKEVVCTTKNNESFRTTIPYRDPELVKDFVKNGVNVSSKKPSIWLSTFISLIPTLLFIGILLIWFRMMRGDGSKAFSFGKSKAKLFLNGKTKITFDDVAGVEEAKEELEEIVEFLKEPKKFQKLGGRIPRGVLLLGRPGTGKTLLAKAVAGEAGVPFFSMSGSDFVEMFVGVGASRVRDLFEQAKKHSPCIAFIDEIDAVGRHRGTGIGGGHDEREQTLNQLLVEMDGFEKNSSVIIIAATNRPDVLDPALLRPGRFDRQVVVDLPDIKGREAILKVHTLTLPVAENLQLSVIARSTPGFSGADLANLCNEAALLAARKNKKSIDMSDFEEAKDKVTMGKERRSQVISDNEKRNTAFHEIGHVLCSIFQKRTESIHKVTIIPRGFSAGATHFLQSDKKNYSRSYLEEKIVELLGGRAAEEIVFGELTTGAGNDIERVSELAKNMVCKWGMSDVLGPMMIGKEEGNVFLGKDMTTHEQRSEQTAKLVDDEIRTIVKKAHQRALSILEKHRELLDILSEELLKKETLDMDEIFDVIKDHVSGDELELVTEKYTQALDMKIDLTPAIEKKSKEENEEVKSESESIEGTQEPNDKK